MKAILFSLLVSLSFAQQIELCNEQLSDYTKDFLSGSIYEEIETYNIFGNWTDEHDGTYSVYFAGHNCKAYTNGETNYGMWGAVFMKFRVVSEAEGCEILASQWGTVGNAPLPSQCEWYEEE